MTRKENWPELLTQTLHKYENRPFRYGESDCWLFISDITDAMCGTDKHTAVYGRYKTWRGALGLMKRKYKVKTLLSLAALFFTRIKPSFASRGDVVMKDGAFGVCLGTHAAFLAEDQGYTLIQMKYITKAWRV